MLAKRYVAVRIATLLLPGLLFAMPAAAEGSRDWLRSADTDRSGTAPKIPQAPVGHRQPTAADIPKNVTKDAADLEREKRDRELDAKLQICRGC
jgi:hypothetical protein